MSDAPAYDEQSYGNEYLPEKSIYPDDRRIFHRQHFEYDTLTEIEAAELVGHTLQAQGRLNSGASATLCVMPVARGIFRLKFWQDTHNFEESSEMLLPIENTAPPGTLTEHDDAYSWAIGNYTFQLFKKPFDFHILHNDTRVFMLETEKIAGKYVTPPLGFRHARTTGHEAQREAYVSWDIQNNERFFGLGEKWNKVEKTSTRATIWAADTCGSNTTGMSYKSLPLLYSTQGWGMMLHTGFRSYWEVGTFSYTSGSTLVEDEKLDLFLFLAPTLKALLSLYTDLTGKPNMPPRWALGIWMSRCMYTRRDQVEAVMARLRAEHIPCDVIHLDPQWMKTHYYYKIGVDACDFVWDTGDWPDYRNMLKQWQDDGFETCLWINPYLPEGTAIYNEAQAKGYLLKRADDSIARLEHGEPAGTVDFTNPEAKTWWKAHLKALVADGAAVFKPDYGDRVSEDAMFYNGKTGKEMHNRFMFLYTQAAFEAVKETRGENIVWRRSGYIGSQRYPGTWAGDTQVSWQGMRGALRGGLSAGFGGEAFWSHDIGGFVGPAPDPELYIRWAQFGLLSPFSRFHGTSPREPWAYGPLALDIVRHYAQLRYALIPYLLACAYESTKTGLPMMRHTRLEFPEEPNVETLDDQYMLGPDLLIAPVLNPGIISRHVYFPAGHWWALEDTTFTVEGPCFAEVPAPLAQIPAFVRAGAILPRYIHQPQHLKEPAPQEMELLIYPGASHKALTITENDFTLQLNYTFTEDKGDLSIQPAPLTLTIVLVDVCAQDVHAAHGLPVTWTSHKHDTLITLDAKKDGAVITFISV